VDFLKLIRSFGDLLFEVLTWLIYFPRTLWLVLRHPLKMITYSDHEQTDAEDEQYTDTLSPPLLLLLTLLLLHGLELAFGTLPQIPAKNEEVRTFFASDEHFVMLRAFLFGLLPLFAALRYVRARGLPLERKNLRPAFYGQCYLAAIYAFMLWLVTSYDIVGMRAGAEPILFAASTLWYWTVQTMQFRRALTISWPRAIANTLWVYLEAAFYLVVVALILSGGGA
jgi:hypothetical protein